MNQLQPQILSDPRMKSVKAYCAEQLQCSKRAEINSTYSWPRSYKTIMQLQCNVPALGELVGVGVTVTVTVVVIVMSSGDAVST